MVTRVAEGVFNGRWSGLKSLCRGDCRMIAYHKVGRYSTCGQALPTAVPIESVARMFTRSMGATNRQSCMLQNSGETCMEK